MTKRRSVEAISLVVIALGGGPRLVARVLQTVGDQRVPLLHLVGSSGYSSRYGASNPRSRGTSLPSIASFN